MLLALRFCAGAFSLSLSATLCIVAMFPGDAPAEPSSAAADSAPITDAVQIWVYAEIGFEKVGQWFENLALSTS